MMIDIQTHFVFPVHAVPPCGRLPGSGELWQMKTPDHNTLHGVHFPPAKGKSDTLVLGFGGNAWNGQDVAEYLHDVFPDVHVVAFHYRGYRPSTGTPSAESLIADAPLVYDFVARKLAPKSVIACGFSIGSGIACTLSAVRKVDGLLLVTPFDSLKAVAQAFYPWLPIAPFFSHEIDAVSALAKSDTPAAIIVAGQDEIIAAERSEALRRRATNVRFDRTIAGAGHNDIYMRSEFQKAMDEALAALGG